MLINTTTVKHASMIFFSVSPHYSIKQVDGEIGQVIVDDHHGTREFSLVMANEALTLVDVLMKLITAVTVGVVGVSFLVSGIGIMNVMLLVVNERTREIGLRKALGAKSYQILLQFLTETVIICLIGSGAGLGLGVGLLKLIGHYYPALHTQMPYYIVEVSVVFSFVIGLLFGLMPAIKAVRVQPMDALRYE